MAEPNESARARLVGGSTVALGLALGLCGLALALIACGANPTQPSAFPTPAPVAVPTPVPVARVAIVSVDGLRPDALNSADTPQILALAARGAYTLAARTVFPSTTLPSHTSMLTGTETAAHGVTFDEYRDSFVLAAPTAMSLARDAGRRTAMVVGKGKLKQLALAGSLDGFVLATRGDVDVVNEAIVLLGGPGLDLLFVHLPQTDQIGHASGWMSAEYRAQLRITDEAVGRLLSLLPVGTTVILTADHGGQHKTHGTRDDVDMLIPWIVAGPRVVRRGPLTRPVRTLDTAPTALSVLGVPQPVGMTGKAVSEPFEAP